MPRSKTILCSGIGFLIVTALNSQVFPKNKSVQQVVGYQHYQQKLWNLHQLPKNSVLYQYNSKYIFQHYTTQVSGLHLSPLKITLPENSYHYSLNTLDRLQSNLQTSRFQYYKWQKQAWWRDPSKGTGALLLKDIFYNNNGFIHQ